MAMNTVVTYALGGLLGQLCLILDGMQYLLEHA